MRRETAQRFHHLQAAKRERLRRGSLPRGDGGAVLIPGLGRTVVAPPVHADVDGDAEEPCTVGRLPWLEAGEGPESPEERLLGGIFGVFGVAQDPPAEREQATFVQRQQPVQGGAVARLPCPQQLGLRGCTLVALTHD